MGSADGYVSPTLRDVHFITEVLASETCEMRVRMWPASQQGAMITGATTPQSQHHVQLSKLLKQRGYHLWSAQVHHYAGFCRP